MEPQKSPLEKAVSLIAQLNYRFRYAIAAILWILVTVATVALLDGWIPREGLVAYGYGGIFIISLLNGAALVFGGPSQVLTFLLAQELSPIVTGIVSGIGTSLGEVSGFALGRTALLITDSPLQAKIDKFKRGGLFQLFSAHTTASLFMLALVPNPFFDIASILSGALGIPLHRYFPPVFWGKIARFVVIAAVGSYLADQ